MRLQCSRSTVGWIFGVVLPLAVLPAVLLSSCTKPKRVVRATRQGPADEDFRDARTQIMLGNFEEAAESMRKLNARNDVPAGLQDWVMIYGGLTELLLGREKEARPLFAQLAERSAAARGSGKLAPFLYDLGIAMSGDTPVPSKVAPRYDVGTYEAIGLYLLGLKDENLDSMDEAVDFYRQFATANATGPELWTGFNQEIKKLRQTALDICEYEETVDAATKSRATAATEGAIEKAVNEAKAARQRIKRQGKLLAALDVQLGDKATALAAQDDADAEAFPLAKAKWAELEAKYEFSEARRAIFDAKLTTTKRKREQETMASRAGYLDQFKFFFLLEFRNEGYAKPVALKNGETVEGGIAKMDDTRMYLRVSGGEKAVLWSEVSPESRACPIPVDSGHALDS